MENMKNPSVNSRREFLNQSGKIITACALMGAGANLAYAGSSTLAADCPTAKSVNAIDATHYYLSQVRLESGFDYDGNGNVVVSTQTDLNTLEIKDGKIVAILNDKATLTPGIPRYDAQGKLMLPAFRDMHIHLDKTFYGGPWQAPRSRQGKTIMDMIVLEQQLLPTLQPVTQQRAGKLIELMHSYGSTIARSHCNVEPVSGVKNIEDLMVVLDKHQDLLTCEIVAFPQHGLLNSKSEPLMREAMKLGAHYVGGLDPTNVDGAMEKSLDSMFQIALDFNKPIDIHLHETGPQGKAAISYMLDLVEKNPSLKGKLTISHAFALATMDEKQTQAMIERLAEQKVTIASTVPLGTLHMPLSQLRANGVFVMTGTDSVIDHWSPFGSGDMLQKANLYAQLYTRPDELTLSRSLAIATGDILPLNDKGARVWPKAQDDASFVLVDASCSAEAVARVSPRQAAFHKGKMAAGTVDKVA